MVSLGARTGQINDGFNTDLESGPENQGKSAAEPSLKNVPRRNGTGAVEGPGGVGGRQSPQPTLGGRGEGTAWPWVQASVRTLLPREGVQACVLGRRAPRGKQDRTQVWAPPLEVFVHFHPQILQACFLSTRTALSMTTAQLLRLKN